MNYKESNSCIVEFFKENPISIIVTTIIAAIIAAFIYWGVFTGVFPGEYYINDYTGEQLPEGRYFSLGPISKVDTTVQYGSMSGTTNIYLSSSYSEGGSYMNFLLNAQEVKAIVLIVYKRKIAFYYPSRHSDQNIESDFSAALENLGKKYSLDYVTNYNEDFCRLLVNEFNRITTSEVIMLNIKLLKLKEA